MSTPLRRVKLNSQPHAPRVCFALHKARFPFSQEATGLLTNLGGPCRHAIARRRCKWSALSGENGRGRGARTPDLRFWRPPLYQLSYTPSRPPHPGRSVRTGKAWRLYGARARLASAKSVFLTTNQCASTCAAHAARILGSSPRIHTPRHILPNEKAPRSPAGLSSGRKTRNYSTIEATMPAPTVRPPSRMAKRSFSSIAIGTISSTSTVTLSPGITISVPSGSVTMPVTSVVRK